MSALQLEVDFSDGLAVIHAEHRQMLLLCKDMDILSRQADRGKLAADFADKAAVLYAYFSVATVRHHQDEEQDLFPIVKPVASHLVEGMMNCLEEDHRELEDVWAFIAPQLAGSQAIDDTDLFAKAATRFTQLLRWHIEREEDNFLPEMEKILSDAQRQKMALGMQQRHAQ